MFVIFLEVVKVFFLVFNSTWLYFTSVLLVPVKWLTGKTVSDITYNVLCGTLNIQPANEPS